MNTPAPIGHNHPPDPLDEALVSYGDTIAEAESWLDGAVVENEGQMTAVEALLSGIKAAQKAVDKAKDEEARPLHEAWKAALARYKPTADDLDRIRKGLIAALDGYKRKLAAEREEQRRAAERAAREAADRAKAAAEVAAATDIDAQREAEAARLEAEIARTKAKAAAAAKVQGMRTVTRYEITDGRALINWIATHDRDALTAFIEEYARKHHKSGALAGVRVWQDREAF